MVRFFRRYTEIKNKMLKQKKKKKVDFSFKYVGLDGVYRHMDQFAENGPRYIE